MLQNFSYVKATSVDEAVQQLAEGGARIHAGGTDLLGCLRDDVFEVDRVVSISGLEALKGIREGSDGALRIGALTPIAEVAASPVIRERAPALAQAAAEVGTPQLRNQGTLGGNVCQKPRCWYYRGPFPCMRKGGGQCFAVNGNNEGHAIFGGLGCHVVHPSDTAPALVALGATARLVGPDGARMVAMEDFFVLPSQDFTRETVLAAGEVVTEVVVPAPASGSRGSYAKVRGRQSWDFALVGVALALGMASDGTVERARVVFSGVAPAPWRSGAAEEVITGARLTPEVIRRAAAAAVEGAQPMSHNQYKVPMMQALLERELAALA
jgi:xanthine dehydrogenase YagS FAD-binding subunit